MRHSGSLTKRPGSDERVELVLDQKDEFRGRVEKMLEDVEGDADYPIGKVTFADSQSRAGLHAADLLAYEARRCLTEVLTRRPPKLVRDQWRQLMNARLPGGGPRIWADYWDPQVLEFTNVLTVMPKAVRE